LINFDGNLIGVVAHKSFEEEGISWAIPIDRVRLWFPYLMQPEEVGGFWTGIEMDMLSDRALVSQVLENSPAWSVGIRAGDAVIAVDGREVKIGPDWPFALYGHKPGDRLKIRYERNGNQFERDLALDENASFQAASGENKEPGLSFALYRGRYANLPDFGKLESIKQGVIRSIQADEIVSPTENAFAIVFSGYVEFPQAGQYRLQLGSDDGSKLYLDGRLIIDNDMPHPYQQLSRWVRVPKGLVPIRVEYAETGGARALKLEIKQGYDPANAMELPFFREKSTPK
jgi:hypothetical protein